MKRFIIATPITTIAIAIILAAISPWTTTLWTPIYMDGIAGSAGFVGKTVIVWKTVYSIAAVIAIGTLVFLIALLRKLYKEGDRMKKMVLIGFVLLLIFLLTVGLSLIFNLKDKDTGTISKEMTIIAGAGKADRELTVVFDPSEVDIAFAILFDETGEITNFTIFFNEEGRKSVLLPWPDKVISTIIPVSVFACYNFDAQQLIFCPRAQMQMNNYKS